MNSPTFAPIRTPAGQAELAVRSLGLTQRQRTVLFLVDGRRDAEQVRQLAERSGAGRRSYDELVALGLVALAIDGGPVSVASGNSSLLPSVRSLLPESGWTGLQETAAQAQRDRPFEEARELLLRAVRSEAPVSGSLTLIKLKRVSTRDGLEALLDEVEFRLRKPRRQIVAAQTMRHVRHLLSLPGAASRVAV